MARPRYIRMPEFGRLPRLGLLARFSVLSLAAFVLIGVVLGRTLTEQIRERSLAGAGQSAELVAHFGIQPQLSSYDVERRNAQRRREPGVTMRAFGNSTLALACTAALLAGCGEKKDSTQSSSATRTSGAAATPKSDVAFLTPKDGAAVNGALLCKVKLTNFTIDPKAVGQSPQPGRGHLHFSLDGGKYDHPKYSGANGKIAVALKVDGKYSPALAPHITYRNLPKGRHKLDVYLANNNHTKVGPQAETEIVVK